MRIHSSCEIEYFVETHLCKLCVILRSRVSIRSRSVFVANPIGCSWYRAVCSQFLNNIYIYIYIYVPGLAANPKITSCLPTSLQQPQLACVRRALASLHASSCSQDWSRGARLLFSLQSPGTSTPLVDRHASFSISNTINVALSVALFSCVQTKLPFSHNGYQRRLPGVA